MGVPELPVSYGSESRPRQRKFSVVLLPLVLGLAWLLTKQVDSFVEQPLPEAKLDAGVTKSAYAIAQFQEARSKCATTHARVGAPPNFAQRKVNDRYDGAGVAPRTRITNATVWTGAQDGQQVLYGADIVLDRGLIIEIADSESSIRASRTRGAELDESIKDVQGAWVTPGIVDVHVHTGVMSLPGLYGTEDTNSLLQPISPYLRSADGLNQHDLSFKRAAAGGVTTALLLPGSALNIGGQAFTIKTRRTKNHYPSERIVEPPSTFVLPGQRQLSSSNTSAIPAAIDDSFNLDQWLEDTGLARPDGSVGHRHLKAACGENARRVFRPYNRQDEAWGFRKWLERARIAKESQDAFCAATEEFAHSRPGAAPSDAGARSFPEDLEIEALVAVLRGQVLVNTHCYTTTDLDSFVRHSNEFKFPVAAFHHAHEAYLVPELLKRAYGKPPKVAMFSTNGNYKAESLYGSPHAAALLKRAGLTPLAKSDHPVTDTRFVVSQAAQFHHFGLDEASSLQAVTSAAAETLGLDHRIGFVKENYDADLVIWNTHPLQLGATPAQVYIDGIPQLDKPHVPSATLPHSALAPTKAKGIFDREIERVGNSSGQIIDIEAHAFRVPTHKAKVVTFKNVAKVFKRDGSVKNGIRTIDLGAHASGSKYTGHVILREGELTICSDIECAATESGEVLDLHGGVILPGLTSIGSSIGLSDVSSEYVASDGKVLDPFSQPGAVGPNFRSALHDWPVARAVDGLQWGGNDLLLAHASGTTKAIVSPQGTGFLGGVSTAFSTSAINRLEPGSIRRDEVALHVSLGHYPGPPAVSEQLVLLRELLEGSIGVQSPHWKRAVRGELPLVVRAARASHIASLIELKKQFPDLRLVIENGAEASQDGLPDHLAENDIAVLLTPRTWAQSWDERRALPGPPLTKDTTLSVLLESGVKVGIRIEEGWQVQNQLWDVTWATKSTDGLLDESDVVALLTTAVDKIFDLDSPSVKDDYVAFYGNPFEYHSKVVAIGSEDSVDLFDN